MKKTFATLALACLFAGLFAQKTTVSGSLKDSLTGQPLALGAVMLFADSQLVSLTYSDENGLFSLQKVRAGEFVLRTNYLGFEDFERKISLKTTDLSQPFVVGSLALLPKDYTISGVQITGRLVPIIVNGDTIDYNAAAFKTQPNANVEDLLKKLPGVEVEKNGDIKAQGEKVNQVLVDGKPFFGNDPKMATQNLPADAISRVKVFDRQSEQAQFTGIRDGSDQGKTIDLRLKDDRKNGVFGKIGGGLGTPDDRREGQGSLFSFKPGRQISLLGMGNNINDAPFSFFDLMGGAMAGGPGSVRITGEEESNQALIFGFQNGLNTVRAGGLNTRFDLSPRTGLTASYFFSDILQKRDLRTNTLFTESKLATADRSLTDSRSRTHRVNFELEHKFDARNSLKISPSFSFQQRDGSLEQLTETRRDSVFVNRFVNRQTRFSTNDGTGWATGGEAIFRHRFLKNGRTFSANSSWNLSASASNSFSKIQFDTIEMPVLPVEIRQKWAQKNRSAAGSVAMNFTEPLTRRLKLETNYTFNGDDSRADLLNFDFDETTGGYSIFQKMRSSQLESRVTGGHRIGTSLQFSKLKWTLTGGLAFQFRPRTSHNEIDGQKLDESFENWLPSLRFERNLPRRGKFNFSWVTSTRLPPVSSLIGAADFSNPLVVLIPNANLKQTFNHRFEGEFTRFQPATNVFFTANAALVLPRGAISQATIFDDFGRQTTQPVNVDGSWFLNGFIDFGLPKRRVKWNFNTFLNASKEVSFINEAKSATRSGNLGQQARLNLDPNDRLEINLTAGLDLNFGQNNLQPDLQTTWLGSYASSGLGWRLPGGLRLWNDLEWQFNGGLAPNFDRVQVSWNSSLTRYFLKDESLEIRLSANDWLNQNRQASREVTAQFVRDLNGRNLARFFRARVIWHLHKKGGGQGGPGGHFVRRGG